MFQLKKKSEIGQIPESYIKPYCFTISVTHWAELQSCWDNDSTHIVHQSQYRSTQTFTIFITWIRVQEEEMILK